MRLASAPEMPRRVHPLRRMMHPVRLRSALRLERAVSWQELFFDLIFVAAVAQLASPLAEDYSWMGLLRFAIFFLLLWWAWSDHTLYYSRFHCDDPLERIMTVAQIFTVAVMAANAKATLSSADAAGFGAAYGLMRLILMLQYLRARRLHSPQRHMTAQIASLAASALLWLVAALSPLEVRFVLWGAAVTLDAVGPWLRRGHFASLPPDSAHLPERFGLFTIILLGEFVASIMRGMEAQSSWPPLAFAAAITGFVIAFLCWWLYFQRCQAAEPQAIPRRAGAYRVHLWTYLHLPLYLSLVVTGVGIEHIIAGGHFGSSEGVLVVPSVITTGIALGLLMRFAGHRTGEVDRLVARDCPAPLLSAR